MLIAPEVAQYHEKLVRACAMAGVDLETSTRLTDDMVCVALCKSAEQVEDVVRRLRHVGLQPVTSRRTLDLEWLRELYYVAIPRNAYSEGKDYIEKCAQYIDDDVLHRAIAKYARERDALDLYWTVLGLLFIAPVAVVVGVAFHYSVTRGMVVYATLWGILLVVLFLAGSGIIRHRKSVGTKRRGPELRNDE